MIFKYPHINTYTHSDVLCTYSRTNQPVVRKGPNGGSVLDVESTWD